MWENFADWCKFICNVYLFKFQVKADLGFWHKWIWSISWNFSHYRCDWWVAYSNSCSNDWWGGLLLLQVFSSSFVAKVLLTQNVCFGIRSFDWARSIHDWTLFELTKVENFDQEENIYYINWLGLWNWYCSRKLVTTKKCTQYHNKFKSEIIFVTII